MILVRSPRSVLSHFTIGSISSSDIEVPEELSASAQPCVRRFRRGLRHRADVDAASPTARLPRRGTALPARAGRSRLSTSLGGPNTARTNIARTWQNGDVGKTPGFDGDTERALASIQAKALIMPAQKDLYFPPEDEQWAAQFIPDAEVRVIPGVWGHFAGGGAIPADVPFIDKGYCGAAGP